MTSKKFSTCLTRWYRKNKRDLPWRKTHDPYKIWISEIMLQQTTVSAVIPYYARWIKVFPDVKSIARAPLQKVLKVWQGLGYYSRARNIHNCAQELAQRYNGKIPEHYEILRRLPGFGPYTTGAVLSIAFDKRFSIIDANVRRVAMRLLALKGEADTFKDKKVEIFLKDVMPQKSMGDFNQGLMELGALICKSKEPACNMCPVKNFCKAYAKNIQEIIPTPKKIEIKDISVAVAIIQKNKKFLIQRRPEKGLLAGLWEFPGGKLKKRESAKKALVREVKEELGCDAVDLKHFMTTRHFYTQFRVSLDVWQCNLKKYPKQDEERKWVSLENLKKYPMPSGDAKILEKLMQLKGVK